MATGNQRSPRTLSVLFNFRNARMTAWNGGNRGNNGYHDNFLRRKNAGTYYTHIMQPYVYRNSIRDKWRSLNFTVKTFNDNTEPMKNATNRHYERIRFKE